MLTDSRKPFGALSPFADPLWYSVLDSPYYNESHLKLAKWLRQYCEDELMPHCQQWEEKAEVPESAQKRHAKLGCLAVTIWPVPREYLGDIKLPADIAPQDWDAFHDFVLIDEMTRCGYLGANWALGTGAMIACPIIMNFGTDEQKTRFLPPVITGEQRACLAVTEPGAGSDVAAIATTAKKEGDYYIVNGAKKWITNAIFAHFCVAAVRTGGAGHAGISCLVIPLDLPGVTRRKLQNSGVASSGSTYIEFEDVKVPASNLIGREGEGFRMFMSNFNHERLALSVQALRLSRVCIEDAFEHANLRKTFGKALIEQPVIRAKFADMGRMIEAVQAQLEMVYYHFNKRHNDADLAGMTALCKVQATRTLEFVNREAQQIFGGLGYQRGGLRGARVEQISRDLRVLAVGGGSDEILTDLGIKQQIRIMKSLSEGSATINTVENAIPAKI